MTSNPLGGKFNLPGVAELERGQGDLPRLAVNTEACQAHMYLHGAHVTHWQPTGQRPVLWVSRKSWFEDGKPIRGGVPVCFPWFGSSEHMPDAPKHGLARLMPWNLESVQQHGEEVRVAMSLRSNDRTRKWWPREFEIRHLATFGDRLTMRLEVRNRGADPFVFGEALHSYFFVEDVRQVSVHGLEGLEYLDAAGGQAAMRREPEEPLKVVEEADRLYCGTQATCVIESPGMGRRIVIDKSGSNSTVVWNPWVEKAQAMPDFGDKEWPQMMCVETANAAEDRVTLGPGATHAMEAAIRLEPYV